MTFLAKAKSVIKRYPVLYDTIDRIRPATLDATETFLDQFSRANAPVRFLQIGANDGMSWDPLRRFIIRDRWEGILVEPVPTAFTQLVANYRYVRDRLTFVNAAIAVGSDPSVTFYVPSLALLDRLTNDQREYLFRMASFSESHLHHGIRAYLGNVSPNDVSSLSVPCLSVAHLVAQHWPGRALDLLVCDAEGFDARIIQSVDFTAVRVRAVVFESHNLPADERRSVAAHLTAHGFTMCEAEGDTIATRHLA